jgi:lipoprotein NlpD
MLKCYIGKAGIWLVLGAVLAVSGCATHGPAPVESREAKARQAAAKPDRYQVRQGDTLYGIAWRYGLDHERLATWNNIRSPYRIYPGQTLRLKSPPAAPRHRPPTKPKTADQTAAAPAPKSKPKPKPKPKTRSSAKSSKVGGSKVTVSPPPATKAVSPAATSLRWVWPTRGSVVQTFRQGDKTRQGIRIAGRSGQPVVAAESGKVVYSGSGLPGYGKLIIIKHNKNYLSAYGFNRKILVQDGESVNRGDQVAEMGQSAGGKSLLHFEIRRSDRVLDPLRVLPKR